VVVPEAVWREVVEARAGRLGAAELAAADWADIADGGDPQLRAALERDLDGGEASALALAVERQADLVPTDERDARLAARRPGLAVAGSLRLLLDGKRRGLLDGVALLIERMRRAGMWVGDEVVRAVCAQAGESPPMPPRIVGTEEDD
jgi:predicted nucleic acid-binding protein